MDSKQILSVGIDIGTSTSQLVFSRLELRNRAAACQIPRFEITDRRIVWQSPVAFTPLTDVDTLDEAALDALIRGWYAEAGVRPEDVETGAVIVTGESLKTVNARRTVMRLADSLGDFVVASAGPHLESVIAGRGAGAAALSEACANLEKNAAYVSALRDKLIAGLKTIPHAALNGDETQRLPGNVNFCFEGIEGESLLLLLDEAGICASSGSACTSGSLDPSHVLLAIGRPHEVAHGSLRLTLCEENTEEQVDHMLREIPRVVEYLRSMSPVWKDLTSGKKQFML